MLFFWIFSPLAHHLEQMSFLKKLLHPFSVNASIPGCWFLLGAICRIQTYLPIWYPRLIIGFQERERSMSPIDYHPKQQRIQTGALMWQQEIVYIIWHITCLFNRLLTIWRWLLASDTNADSGGQGAFFLSPRSSWMVKTEKNQKLDNNSNDILTHRIFR